METDIFLHSLSPIKKKLYWRSIKRGMKEMDLILGGFARENLPLFTADETEQFSHIIHCYDQDLLEWITNKKDLPSEMDTPLFKAIKNFIPKIF